MLFRSGAFKRIISLERLKVIPIFIFLLTNLTIVFIFITITKFVSTRYSMLFCLALILFIPLILDKIIERVQQTSLKILYNRVLILFFGYCAFDSFISFGSPKTYINESLTWYQAENHLHKRLITNNHAIAYFSEQAVCSSFFIESGCKLGFKVPDCIDFTSDATRICKHSRSLMKNMQECRIEQLNCIELIVTCTFLFF